MDMPLMRRIERPAEKADDHAAHCKGKTSSHHLEC
jgi:hypothetical protein